MFKKGAKVLAVAAIAVCFTLLGCSKRLSSEDVRYLASQQRFSELDRAVASGYVTRFRVLTTLTSVRTESALQYLDEKLDSTVEPGLKIMVLVGLQNHDRRDAVSIIRRLAKDPTPEVKNCANNILEKWGELPKSMEK